LREAVRSVPEGIPYLILENDGELAAALNQGARAATTEYVLRLDADDILDTESVHMQVQACWDVDVAYPSLLHITEDGGRATGITTPGEFCGNRLQVWNYIPGAGCVIRRKKLLEVGGWHELPTLEDWDLWIRLFRAGGRFKWVTDARYLYRNVQASRNKMVVEKAVNLKHKIVGAEPPLLATFYSQETVATTYWRCLLPARVMPAQVWNHRPLVQIHGDEILLPHHRGVAVWQFPGHEYERQTMAAMQELGIPCLVECDDNYLIKAPRGRGWKAEPPKRGDTRTWPAHDTHRKIVKWCDGLIVTTEHLANQYRKVTDAPVFVCPNQIDPGDWPERELPDWYDPEKTYVGIAGSASHIQDMSLVMQALEWCAGRKNVEAVVFGPILTPQMAGRLSRAGGFRHIPWTSDMSVLRAMLRILDIGLAPVKATPWSSCRSDVKALEYLMGGAVPVLSDVIPYRDWVDGDHCRKASDARGFLRAVQDLVYGADRRIDLAATGRAYVLTHRTMGHNANLWREAVTTVTRRELIAA
jgi:hypothetical protein